MTDSIYAKELGLGNLNRPIRFIDPVTREMTEGTLKAHRACAAYIRVELHTPERNVSDVYRIAYDHTIVLSDTEEKEPEMLTDAGAAALIAASSPFRNAVPAAYLNGTSLHKAVRFNWTFSGSGVRALITGYLREIHHDLEGVTLWVSADDEGTAGKTEFILSAETNVDVAK